MTSLERFARVEVKSTWRMGDDLWIGTKIGLFKRVPGSDLMPIPGHLPVEIRGLGPSADGFLYIEADPAGDQIVMADAAGAVRRRLPGPKGEKLVSASALRGCILVATKTGLFREKEDGWERLYGGEDSIVTAVHELSDRISLFVKKQGVERKPALVESFDDGLTWQMTESDDYGDTIIAVSETSIVTKWRGARLRGSGKGGYKKHPITAAEFYAGSILVVDGDKIEIAGPGRRKMEVFHPRVAEAEQVHLVPDGLFVSGAQGAYLLDPLTGSLRDLAADVTATVPVGKRKKLFALDEGVVLAACTFGTFTSRDGGAHWVKSDAEWDVLDAEHAARGPNDEWYILCQRGVFVTRDNGGRIDYLKPKLPHGSRHFGEFRALAVGGNTLWLGTKAGLFAASIERPEHLAPVDAFGVKPVDALAIEGDRLLVALEEGGIYERPLAGGDLSRRSDVTLKEGVMIHDGGSLLLVDERGVSTPDQAATIPAIGGLHGCRVTASGTCILVWNGQEAWSKARGEAWVRVGAWPQGVRSVALLGAAALVTDRDSIGAVSLAAA